MRHPGPAARAVAHEIARLLPPQIATGVIELARVTPAVDLRPEEAAVVAGAVDGRRREFAAGRRLARQLLRKLGAPDEPLLSAVDRAPRWPLGFTGSIAHAGDLCTAAVALDSQVAAVGIDLECDAAVTPDLWPAVLRPEELAWVESEAAATATEAPVHRATVVFVAKEAVYKAVSRRAARVLEFDEVRIRPLEAGRFDATIEPLGIRLSGCTTRAAGYVLGTVVLPR